MTAGQTIDYETLAQEAMRGLVRTVLIRTAKSGLPGDHHFYISFDTGQPGVSLSKRLKEKYPREMTIVLQHRFWDLIVSDDRFEVKLTFDGIPERLVVPFAAIKVFFDPSVRYGLQFEESEALSDNDAPPLGMRVDTRSGRSSPMKKQRAPRKPRVERDSTMTGDAGGSEASPEGRISGATSANEASNGAEHLPHETNAGERGNENPRPAANKPAPGAGAEIVSLDKFRKK